MSRTLGELIAEAEAEAPAKPSNGKQCWFKDYARQIGDDAPSADGLLAKKQAKETKLTYREIGKVLGEFADHDPIHHSTVAMCVRRSCNACRSGVPRL